MKISKTFMALVGILGGIGLSLTSCGDDWGRDDPAADGWTVYPTTQKLTAAKVLFDDEATSMDELAYINAYGGETCELVADDSLNSQVLHLNSGYVRMVNPFTTVALQTGGAIAMQVRTDGIHPLSRLFAFAGEALEDGNVLQLSQNGRIQYDEQSIDVNSDNESTLQQPDKWAWVVTQLNVNGYVIYVNGETAFEQTYTDAADLASWKALVERLNTAPYLYIGGDEGDLYVDNINFVSNTIDAADVQCPKVPRNVKLPNAVYQTDFETQDGMTIVGGGSFVDVGGDQGVVFRNVASASARQNYLLLPSHVLSHSAETQEMTIAFWVSAEYAGAPAAYPYAPLFSAYANTAPGVDNGAPMLMLQSRGLMQVNCNGWSDFGGELNVDKKNHVYNQNAWEANDPAYIFSGNWLEDQQWHLYTVTMTKTSAIIYMDGEVKNEWQLNGTSDGQVLSGLFTNGADLKYVCLGGNQAWNWGDPDAGFMFDNFKVYDKALTQEQILKLMNEYGEVKAPEAVLQFDFETQDGLTIQGSGSFVNKNDKHGIIFRNAASSTPRQNWLYLPEDALSHSSETKQMSISFWVNASQCGESSSYMWAPFLTAYGSTTPGADNGYPMFALQYRGVTSINYLGYCDFNDAQNDAGAVTLYHGDNDWLSDREWHFYTAVFTENTAAIYHDGTLANSWHVSNSGDGNVMTGLYTANTELRKVCLGGNQAWNWTDNDAAFEFDDVRIFDKAISPAEIQALMNEY